MNPEGLSLFDLNEIRKADEIKTQKIKEKQYIKDCKKNPDISICCLLSRPKFIKWAIYQCHKQKKYLKNKGISCEIVVISNDNQIIKNVEKYVNKSIFFQSTVIGTIRNEIMKYTIGKYIGFIDDDDWYPAYRMHLQYVALEFYHKGLNIHTVDRFFCYDLINTYEADVSSESCLFFRKGAGIFDDTAIGEGGKFCSGKKVYIENEIDLILALRTDSNSSNFKLNFVCVGLHQEIKKFLDKFELDFLEKLSNV